MKKEDFLKFRDELKKFKRVEFSTREELIDFFSDMLSDQYRSFAITLMGRGIAQYEYFLGVERKPQIVKLAVEAYLNSCIPKTPTTLLDALLDTFSDLICFFKRDIIIDMNNNKELYEKIIENLERNEDPKEIFDEKVVYYIEGQTILKMKTS